MKSREQVIEALQGVINQLDDNDRNQVATKSILYALKGAWNMNEVDDLSNHVSIFTKQAIRRIDDYKHQPKHEATGMDWLFGVK